MSTGMYRLQISLPPDQMDFLRQRAKRDGHSIARVIRELVERASAVDSHLNQAEIEQVMSLAGIARDANPLVDGVPVSENPDLYLLEASDQSHKQKPVLHDRHAPYKTRRRKKSARASRGK